MAFDGITIANIVSDMNRDIINGRISKIAQPEPDELLLTIKGNKGQFRLLLSASASLPLVYFTSVNKQSPMKAPNFCMLLRKHIASGRIISITQPKFERIINFEIEHYNELGDLCRKQLIIEIMGKHSNIIFADMENNIIDSIKHISASTSSVREVLPGRPYFITDTQHKLTPIQTNKVEFEEHIFSSEEPLFKSIYLSYTGISPLVAKEICYRAEVGLDQQANSLNDATKNTIYNIFEEIMKDVINGNFTPNIITKDQVPIEYASLSLHQFKGLEVEPIESISVLLQQYYARKESYTRIRQKSVDLRRIVTTTLDRSKKKYKLQQIQYKDTLKKDKYKIYGELLHTYGYEAKEGDKKLDALNYYDNQMLTIPLDPQLSANDNAKKYFAKYNKLKRTAEALDTLLLTTKAEIDHLESIEASLDIAEGEEDLVEIKQELMDTGYIRKHHGNKKPRIKSKPFHYISSDGFHIYVGKNNIQNDQLTFKFANGGDWWFHTKGIPGSHVVLRTEGNDVPDRAFEEAAACAAYYSKASGAHKVDIDYLERKNVKKPNGSAPGYVIYYTNYSMTTSPSISNLTVAD